MKERSKEPIENYGSRGEREGERRGEEGSGLRWRWI
jgi:hypothetical protein